MRKNGVVTVTETDVKRNYWRTHMRYIFTNARPTPVTIDFTQNGLNTYNNDTRVPFESPNPFTNWLEKSRNRAPSSGQK